MENEETEKQQLDEALKRVGDKLRKQSKEYTEFKKMKTTETPRTDAYYAGKGCECSAHNRSECCCDVDWTDPRIYELQAEVESLNSRIVELKHKQASLIAAINTAITEFPSNQASIYLAGIMEKLFQK